MSDPFTRGTTELRSRLAAVTPRLVQEMQRLIATPIDQLDLPWEAAEFEVDPIFYNVVAIPLGDEIIPDLAPDVIAFDVFSGADDDFDPDQIVADLAMEWLADGWQAAGGSSFPYPGRGYFHDYPERYDFLIRRWLTD